MGKKNETKKNNIEKIKTKLEDQMFGHSISTLFGSRSKSIVFLVRCYAYKYRNDWICTLVHNVYSDAWSPYSSAQPTEYCTRLAHSLYSYPWSPRSSAQPLYHHKALSTYAPSIATHLLYIPSHLAATACLHGRSSHARAALLVMWLRAAWIS